MGDPRGFMKYNREQFSYVVPQERVKNFDEFLKILPNEAIAKQGARCMDCGVPFCHTGCPLGNIIPDWNDLVYRGRWQEGLDRLHATNNFPEFTGRICPAPCESACVLGINEDPVTIKQIEMTLADRGFEEGWILPQIPTLETGKSVAIIGSGPAGLAAGQQLRRAGHQVTIFERADRPGGLMMYGIPNYKLEKAKILRRVEQMTAEGVQFCCNTNIGVDKTAASLREDYDVVLIAAGSTVGRDLPIPGREAKGVHFAMEFLPAATKKVLGDQLSEETFISAKDKDVIVIGGGDTGSDCVGTSNRHGARSVTQFEIMPIPEDLGTYPRAHQRPLTSPWPHWTMMLRTSSSHEEGADRQWCILTEEFIQDEAGNLTALKTVEVEWSKDEEGRHKFDKVAGSEKEWPCQLVTLAMGFVGPEKKGAIAEFDIDLDPRGNIKADENYRTSVPGVFSAGDCRRGQSLVVWAIYEGREAARAVDKYLMGTSQLPSTNSSDYVCS